ncbi:MAG: carbon storage regulator [Planctomycetia bacterium]|nr:carbon storage regulator [Planctomycetia bacterium]
MLVLSRKPGQSVHIADDIVVSVLSVQGNRVRLGIAAPDSCRILRGELAEWITVPPPNECLEAVGAT